MDLIRQRQYFVIHAARQSGKTTLLLDLVKKINKGGDFHALYCSLESIQGLTDPIQGILGIMRVLKNQLMIQDFRDDLISAWRADPEDYVDGLRMALTLFRRRIEKPLIILFDEIDCLSNDTLINFLRQLRSGYVNRSAIPFVDSVGLIGMRNIRDYQGKIREDRETLGSASLFNIVTESLTLENFSRKEVVYRYLGMKAQNEIPPDRNGAFPKDTEALLDMKRLLTDFQAFWREHSEIWLEPFQYKEAAPHLVLMAFLQKLTDQKGFITREGASS